MAVGVRALEAGKALIRLAIDDSAVTRGLQSARRRLQTIGRSIAGIGASITAVGGAGIALFAPTIAAASDLEETMSKFNTVFGDTATEVKKWGDNLAQQIGRSEKQIAEFLGNNQDLFVPMGFDAESAEEISKTLTTLAFDLASFNNKQDAEGFRDLQSAFVGTGETMVKYGVVINEATLAQELFNQGLDPKNVTLQQKALAKLSIIMRKTSTAQGDAARTADSYANQMKRLRGVVDDVSAEIGKALAPALAQFLQKINSFAAPFKKFISENQQLVQQIAIGAAATAAIGATILATGGALTIMGTAVGVLATAFSALATPAGALVATTALLIAVSTDLRAVMEDLAEFVSKDLMSAFAGISDAFAAGDLSLAGEIVGKTFLVGFISAIDDAADTLVTALGSFLGPQFAGAANFLGDTVGGLQGLGTDVIVEKLRGDLIDLRQEAKVAAREMKKVGDSDTAADIESVSGAVDKLGGLFEKLGGSARGSAAAIAEETQRIEEDARRLEEQTATPYEKFLQKRKEINDLFEKGAVSGITADRGIKAAFEEYQRTDEAQQQIIENEKRLKQVQEDRFNDLKGKAESIAESIKTPAEKLQDEIRELQEVAAAGLLNPRQFDAALEAINEKKRDLSKVAESFQLSLSGLGPLLGGALAEQVFGTKTTDSLQKQMVEAQKKNNETAKKIEKNTRNAGARFQ